jgi:predicted HTH domain antitoxin
MPKENLQIEVPEAIRGTQLEKKVLDKAARHAFEQTVIELYKDEEISTETGAKLLGMSLWEFLPWLGQHHVPVFSYGAEDLGRDVQAAEAAGKLPPGRRKKSNDCRVQLLPAYRFVCDRLA